MSYTPTPPASYHAATPPPPPPKPNILTNPPLTSQTPPSSSPYPPRTSSYGVPQPPPPPPPPPHPVADYQMQYQQWTGYNQPQSQYEGASHQQPEQQPPQPAEEVSWTPEILLDKSKADLQHALSHSDILHALVHAPSTAPPAVAASVTPLQTLLAQNRELAARLLSLLSTLESAREGTSARLLALRALENQWKKKQTELERRLEPWGPRELHQRLGAAIAEGEAMCRGIEESFIEGHDGEMKGERETGEWVKRVREGRKVVALRKERKARWDEGRVGGWR